MPLPSKRNTPGLGSAFADVETTQLNLFFADTVAHAIETLATAAKKVSGGKLMTMSFCLNIQLMVSNAWEDLLASWKSISYKSRTKKMHLKRSLQIGVIL